MRHKGVSVLLSVLMFIFSFAFMILLILRAGNAATVIRNTEITEFIGVNDFSYYILSQLNGLPFHEVEIDMYAVEGFIRSDAASEEIGNVLNGYTRAFARGDLSYYVTTNEMLEAVRNLEPELSDLFNHQMTEADNERLVRAMDDAVGFSGFSIGGVLEDAGVGTVIPFLIASTYLLWGVGIIFAALLFITYRLHREKAANVFLLAGIPVALSGIIILAAGLIPGVFPQLMSEISYRLTVLANGVAHLVIWHGAVGAAVGTLSIALYFILRHK